MLACDVLLKVRMVISDELSYWIGLTDFADGDTTLTIFTVKANHISKYLDVDNALYYENRNYFPSDGRWIWQESHQVRVKMIIDWENSLFILISIENIFFLKVANWTNWQDGEPNNLGGQVVKVYQDRNITQSNTCRYGYYRSTTS